MHRSVLVRLVARYTDAGARQELAQMFDRLLVADVALVRMMQKILDPVEHDAKARTVRRLDRRAQVHQQRFDLAPVDIAAEGILKDGAQQVEVLVAQSSRYQDM